MPCRRSRGRPAIGCGESDADGCNDRDSDQRCSHMEHARTSLDTFVVQPAPPPAKRIPMVADLVQKVTLPVPPRIETGCIRVSG